MVGLIVIVVGLVLTTVTRRKRFNMVSRILNLIKVNLWLEIGFIS
jgi:hypothetical protein